MMLYRMIGALDRNLYEVFVISLLGEGEIAKRIEADYKIPVKCLNFEEGLNKYKFIILLGQKIKAFHPDLVHTHMYHANIAARITRLFYKMPVLINTIHNIDESGHWLKQRIRLLIYRLTNSLCDLVTQVSKAGVKKYLSTKAVSADRLLYVPNGIQFSNHSISAGEKSQLKANLSINDHFVFLAIGSLTKQKDYPNLLHAFKMASKGSKEIVLLIAGGGPLERELKSLVSFYNIEDKVIFLGIRDDVPSLLQIADVFVMSSAWEGMPIVLLEAAAARLPIVTTDVGGNNEVVINGENGYLVPPRNAQALAEAMLKMYRLNDPERCKFGEFGFNFVKKNYSLEAITNKWESIYEKSSQVIIKSDKFLVL